MAGVNNDTMHNDELLDDGEVIDGETKFQITTNY
jgi:hypothetical protein